MAKKKTIRHMGMRMTEEEHRRWHEQHKGKKDLTPAEHAKLRKCLGVSEKEDRKWHESHGPGALSSPVETAAEEAKPVSVFAIGAGFLMYCVKQGWLTQRGLGRAAKYYVTGPGRKALARFGITKC
jgi:hypothetical protein